MNSQDRKPCSECPFSRDVKPGDTGGSDVRRYVGHSLIPSVLPCHMDNSYSEKRDSGIDALLSILPCAGAAIFRSNIDVACAMPKEFLNLPANTELVFANFEELVSHHNQVSIVEAKMFLLRYPPELCAVVEWEIAIQKGKVILVKCT